jgi:hypothetical protein
MPNPHPAAAGNLPWRLAMQRAGFKKGWTNRTRCWATKRDGPAAARESAAQALLDRGWGKAPQPHVGEADNDIRITIRQIVEGRGNGNG